MVSDAYDQWSLELTDDPERDYLLNGIKFGFDILEGKCPEFAANMSNYRSATETCRSKVEAQIRVELAQNNYRMVHNPPKVVSSLGAIPKTNGKIRIIHDLSRQRGGVDNFVEDSSVSYLTVDFATSHMRAGCYLAKVDLKSAYRSIPIHSKNYPYMGLSWIFSNSDKKCYMIDTKLPFGSKKACKIFTAISNAIARILKKKGVLIINYLDDLLIIADTKEKCWLDLDTTINVLVSLGLEINWDKVEPPNQKITFLGVLIDTCSRTLSLPDDKLSDTKNLVKLWLTKKRATKKELQQFIGKLNWACRVVRGGRTFLRRLINATMKLKATHHRTWLNAEVRADIAWWASGLDYFHGSTSFVSDIRPPSSELITDACRVAGGGIYEHDWFFTDFHSDFPEYVNSHINCLELLTVLVGARRWGHLWDGTHIRVKCDNMASVFAINKGTSRSPDFMKILRELFWLSIVFNFRLSAIHVKGIHNSLADTISRLHMPDQQFKLLSLLGCSNNGFNCVNNMSTKSFLTLQGFTRK